MGSIVLIWRRHGARLGHAVTVSSASERRLRRPLGVLHKRAIGPCWTHPTASSSAVVASLDAAVIGARTAGLLISPAAWSADFHTAGLGSANPAWTTGSRAWPSRAGTRRNVEIGLTLRDPCIGV